MYQNAYDQPKVKGGYSDEQDDQPYRYIKDWYFCSSKDPAKRLPLPEKQLFFPSDYVLVGRLQPVNQKMEPEFVAFDNLSYYAVDRTPEYRGYWVATQRDDEKTTQQPLYWLQEPCVEKKRRGHSQEDVQFNARVALAAISLLCDRVFSGKTGQRYVNMAVEQVLEEKPLLQTKEMTSDELLTLEKFVLARHRDMIGVHMLGHYARLTKNSKFLRSLSRMKVDDKLTDSDILRWTEAAEEQLQQLPWGGTRSIFESEQDEYQKERHAEDQGAVRSSARESSSAKPSLNNSKEKQKSTKTPMKKQSGAKRRLSLSEEGTASPTTIGNKAQEASPPELSESMRKRCRRIVPGLRNSGIQTKKEEEDNKDRQEDVSPAKTETSCTLM